VILRGGFRSCGIDLATPCRQGTILSGKGHDRGLMVDTGIQYQFKYRDDYGGMTCGYEVPCRGSEHS